MQRDAYIAFGSNLGDRLGNIQGGLAALNDSPSIVLVSVSTIIETLPIGPGSQSNYLNGVAKIKTELNPNELLELALQVESKFGRDRAKEERWGARTLDLDIIVFGEEIIEQPGLSIPHPRVHERSFVLIPLAEIAPDLKLPGHKKTPQELLEALEMDLDSED
ncbi:MAG: 2-amino-4-hydroxy-6-hydroxymethyldihydropteridine diphosphokinase [Phycisphaerales bacterium]|nr:2-amino-4-hydroxy-6-hydroxymethyldihydropteridine diphosphokinase [Phycisphaerales bacterium]